MFAPERKGGFISGFVQAILFMLKTFTLSLLAAVLVED